MNKRTYLIDSFVVLLFVAIGRHAHKHGFSISGMASTTWPFAMGLLSGWLFIKITRRNAVTRSSGFIIVLLTVAFGMLLRLISGQGTAISFIIVAFVFLSLFLVGWRTAISFITMKRELIKQPKQL